MGECRAEQPMNPTNHSDADPLNWFSRMLPNCLSYAQQAKANGRPVVGIMCEFTPRELILAAGAVPVCLCGGSAKTIAAAEQHLPSNLCPLIKSTYGYHVTKGNPFLEMADLIVAETTCDGKKKMFELMGQTRPMYVLELPQKVDEEESMEQWRHQLIKFKAELERRFHVEITNVKLRQAIALMNRERKLRRELALLMRRDHPPLTGRQLIEFKSTISGIECDLTQYEKAIHGFTKSETQSPKPDPVRVLLTGVPLVHGAERVLEIIEGAGGLVVAMENCTGLKPIIEDVDEQAADPLRALAEKYLHLPCSVMTPNRRRFDLLRQLATEYRPQCVIELIWQACLTYSVESLSVRRLAEQELGLPYLRIETDYSPSDTSRIAMRVEALYETIQAASAARGRT